MEGTIFFDAKTDNVTMNYPLISEDVAAVRNSAGNFDKLSHLVTDKDLAEAYTDEFGVKYSKDRRRLLKASRSLEGNYKILDSVLCICDYAFTEDGVYEKEEERLYHLSGCSRLTGIDIPDSVMMIGDAAFACCTGLTSVNIPAGVTKIGMDVFRCCTGIISVNIPYGVTEIGMDAFWGCTGLTSVDIPDSVYEILNGAFYGCDKLSRHDRDSIVARFGEKVFEEFIL